MTSESSESSIAQESLKKQQEERKNYRNQAIERIKSEGFGNNAREVELEPQELERRIRILKEYLQLLIDTKFSTGRAYTDEEIIGMKEQRIQLSSNPYIDSLLVVRNEGLTMGLTYKELFELSEDPDWQYLVIDPSSPPIGAQ